MAYEDENHQFCTVVRNDDDEGVTLTHPTWGTFTTKRFDGSIYWDGAWRKNLKPGDKIPVSRVKRGNGYAYMTGFDLHAPEERIMDYINQPKQEAVVTSVIQTPDGLETKVEAFSPVWKTIYYEAYGMIDVQRGDIVVFSRKKKDDCDYKYHLVENKTQEEIKNKGIAKILKDFDESDRTRLLILSDEIRMGITK